ncbi:MAG: hypothetical protein DMENIID0002_01690 [Rickettsia endosymbiont of Sergentomyia squamirostris]|uniref:Uncharacterized protein n=1 Tax=Candidatus Tisiphia endosymbiont of Sergentomyia squamirostris TaxID=3113639 RepID=A0AAT9G6W3_9RICK
MKNNMVDDFDYDSKKAFIEKEYEKLEGRVRNATSRTQLASIIADAANLALIASQYGIDLGGVLELIATAVSKTVHYETEQTQSKDSNEGVISAEEQERIDREQIVQGIYKGFDAFYNDSLNRQRKDNKNLHEVYEATKAGRELTEEEKKKYKKTPEEIAEEKARSQHMELTKKEAEKEKERHANAIKKIEEREKQLVHLPEEHPERLVLANQKQHHEHHHGLANEKLEQYDVYHTERKQHAHNICIATKLAKEKGINEDFFKDQAAIFNEMHGAAPEKVAKELTTKEQQAFITLPLSRDGSPPSASPAALLSSQKLEPKQIIPDPDKETSKIEERVCNLKKRLGGENEQKTPSDTNIKPDPTPPNLKESNKVKGQGTGRAGRL